MIAIESFSKEKFLKKNEGAPQGEFQYSFQSKYEKIDVKV